MAYFAVLSVLIVSNVLILVAQWRLHFHCKSLTSVNAYVTSLTITETLFGIFFVVASVESHLVMHNDAGSHSQPFLCFVTPYFQMLCLSSNVFCMLAIALDLFYVVRSGTSTVSSNQRRRRLTIWSLVVVWLSAAIYSVRAVIHEPDVSDPDDTHAINNHHFHNDDDNSSWKEPLTVTDGTTVAPFPSGRLCNLFVDKHFTDLLPRILDLIVLFIVPILVQLVLYVAVATKLWTNQVGLRSNTVSDFLVFRCSRAEPFRMATADNRMQYLRLSSSGHFALSAILLRTFRCFYC